MTSDEHVWIVVLDDGETFTSADGCEVRALTESDDASLDAGEPVASLGNVVGKCTTSADGVTVSMSVGAVPATAMFVLVLNDRDTYSLLDRCTIRRLRAPEAEDDDLYIDEAVTIAEFQVLSDRAWALVTTVADTGLA